MKKINLNLNKMLVVITFLFLSLSSFAQNDILDKTIKDSPNIFVGKAISYKVFKSKNGSNAASVIINVTEVIKGNINKGTVELVFPCSGAVDSVTYVEISNEQEIPQSDAIYFTKNAGDWALNSKIANSNNLTLEINAILPFNANNELTKINGRIWVSFNKVTEVYDYFEKNYGIKVDKSLYEKKNAEETKEKSLKNIPSQKEDSIKQVQNKLLYEERKKNCQQYEENLKLKNLQQKKEDTK